jgi:hypothetical protein
MIKSKILKVYVILAVSLVLILSILEIHKLSHNSENNVKATNTIDSGTVIQCDWPYYPSLDSLINSSDIIIIGEITENYEARKVFEKLVLNEEAIKENKEVVEELQKRSFIIITDSDVKVNKVLKGNIVEGSTIKLNQMGRTYEGKEYIYEGVKMFVKGKKAIFFIEDLSEEFPDTPYGVLSPLDGYFYIEEGKVHPNTNDSMFKTGLTENEIIKIINDTINNLRGM